MAETYKVKLFATSPFIGTDVRETVDLEVYGYTNEQWDALTDVERYSILDEWAMDFAVNNGFEFSADVEC